MSNKSNIYQKDNTVIVKHINVWNFSIREFKTTKYESTGYDK